MSKRISNRDLSQTTDTPTVVLPGRRRPVPLPMTAATDDGRGTTFEREFIAMLEAIPANTLPREKVQRRTRLTLPSVPERYTQRERDEAAVMFGLWLDSEGFTREYRFSARRFRFDHANIPLSLAVEIDGGHWLGSKGRHTNPQGFERDLRKMNHAALAGWVALRFTIDMILAGEAMQTVETALAQAKARKAAAS